ncbi:MAG: 4-hydroxythreonine-4-phosphate dehydrogenase PdxA [Planctomycetaceae bacterium]|jgi:4-hydroxythreonine-4-phosphate dehydrogenase|nr:4-hydroxythreonine-4-phosphate dehydrogenase PdxA [Planctomycetaceae bacterium]
MGLIGITIGDVAGIGAEIIVRAWSDIVDEFGNCAVVFGHPEILRRAIKLLKLDLEVVTVDKICNIFSDITNAVFYKKQIPCISCSDDSVLQVLPASIDKRAGEAAFRAINFAIEAALSGEIDAVVTAPIHKGSLNLAGYNYPGHTEIFAQRCGVNDYAMMLYLPAGKGIYSTDGLAVVHVTLHTAMRNIFEQITIDSVFSKIKLADEFMTRLTNRRPVIGVCSLNPHAGEGGLFGDEEKTKISPAIELSRRNGINVCDVSPADTIMIDARNGKYDAVVAMFHDQGHIALKLLDMHRAVNVTLGLPIIRTSVAHGTAFDKAWQGQAETGSMLESFRTAKKLVENKYKKN